jgi:hypothetical protein
MTLKSAKYLRDLRRSLTKNFDLDELHMLASELETEKQLSLAKSIKGAILPNGSRRMN